MAKITVRPIERRDAASVALSRARAWQEAYRGLLPPRPLAMMTDPGPLRFTGSIWIEAPGPGETRLVAEDAGRVVGAAWGGPAIGEACGELYAINVDPDAWGKGAGRALVDAVLRFLREGGHVEAVLWMLEGNERAARFYEAGGWRLDGGRKTGQPLPAPQWAGVDVVQVRYRRPL